jgi:hypothetical protein
MEPLDPGGFDRCNDLTLQRITWQQLEWIAVTQRESARPGFQTARKLGRPIPAPPGKLAYAWLKNTQLPQRRLLNRFSFLPPSSFLLLPRLQRQKC